MEEMGTRSAAGKQCGAAACGEHLGHGASRVVQGDQIRSTSTMHRQRSNFCVQSCHL